MNSRTTPMRTPSSRSAARRSRIGLRRQPPDAERRQRILGVVADDGRQHPRASSTVRQIGPCLTFRPGPFMPARLMSSCVGDSPTTLLDDEGMRIEVPVSSPIAQVTRFAATPTAEPELEPRGVRSVSYAIADRAAERAARVDSRRDWPWPE